ncbi:MAG: rod shape-determining protein MreC, partial [Armatimonadota bacterium]|nr:rod shape-determining protein MreC [Armatimonadota bacterium]
MRAWRLDRNAVLLLVVLALVAVAAALDRRGRDSEGRSLGTTVVHAVVSPLQRALTRSWQGVARTVEMFREVRRLYVENRQLRDEVDRLRKQVEVLSALGEENLRLREMLRFRETLPPGGGQALAANVIGMRPTNWYNTVIIDVGANQGVRERQPVLTPRGLVGQVRMVTPNTATVLLVTDPNSGVGARVERSGWNGVARGTAGPTLDLVHLPRDADVVAGDVVVTNGMGTVIKVKGIRIGVVEEVRLDENTST